MRRKANASSSLDSSAWFIPRSFRLPAAPREIFPKQLCRQSSSSNDSLGKLQREGDLPTKLGNDNYKNALILLSAFFQTVEALGFHSSSNELQGRVRKNIYTCEIFLNKMGKYCKIRKAGNTGFCCKLLFPWPRLRLDHSIRTGNGKYFALSSYSTSFDFTMPGNFAGRKHCAFGLQLSVSDNG